MDWTTVGFIGFVTVIRAQYIIQLRDIHNLISSITNVSYDENLETLTGKFNNLSGLKTLNQKLMIIAMILCIYQFFIYSSFHPRVAIVINTIKGAIFKLAPVLSIFLFFIMVYAIIGVTLYGGKIETWNSLTTAIPELFLFILGQFDSYHESKWIVGALN